jgi:hypothetical protein
VKSILRLLAPVLALGLGLIFLCRDWLLPLLFAPRLLAARELLGPQLLGDWAKFLSWLFIFQLTAQARTGRYILPCRPPQPSYSCCCWPCCCPATAWPAPHWPTPCAMPWCC